MSRKTQQAFFVRLFVKVSYGPAAVALYQIRTQELWAWNLDCFTRNVITGLITLIVSAQSTLNNAQRL
ncbi:MAG: hypothetical protein K9M08_10570 [Pirellula sp.]|nr:hypothetical protein [Pirellula sp.]